VVVVILSGCGGDGADNEEAFRAGQRVLDRLATMPGAERMGEDRRAVRGDDGAPGETVYGAARTWRLGGRGPAGEVLSFYAAEIQSKLGYRRGTGPGHSGRRHQNWFRGDECIELLVTTDGLLFITAGARCSG
jgi:hypothetical protein